HLDAGEFELLLDRAHDAHADVDRVADRLLLVVVVGERDRRVAMADGDGAGLLDLVEGAFLGQRGRREKRAGERRGGGLHCAMHCRTSWVWGREWRLVLPARAGPLLAARI